MKMAKWAAVSVILSVFIVPCCCMGHKAASETADIAGYKPVRPLLSSLKSVVRAEPVLYNAARTPWSHLDSIFQSH